MNLSTARKDRKPTANSGIRSQKKDWTFMSKVFSTGSKTIRTWDFSFEWKEKKPDIAMTLDLIKEINEILVRAGVKYSIISTLDDSNDFQAFKVQVPKQIKGESPSVTSSYVDRISQRSLKSSVMLWKTKST